PIVKKVDAAGATQPIEVDMGSLAVGGYTAKAKIGAAPPGRLDFACEKGGEAWQDSRPDPSRLERIARATQGTAVGLDEIDQLPTPPASRVSVERHGRPMLPPWVWAFGAVVRLGAHWLLRRRGGLTYRRSVSVVVLVAEVRDQFLAHDPTQGVLQLHEL